MQLAANLADILTKPVSTKVFETLRDVTLNVRRTAVNLHAIVASKTRCLFRKVRLGADPRGSMRVPVRAPAVAARADA